MATCPSVTKKGSVCKNRATEIQHADDGTPTTYCRLHGKVMMKMLYKQEMAELAELDPSMYQPSYNRWYVGRRRRINVLIGRSDMEADGQARLEERFALNTDVHPLSAGGDEYGYHLMELAQFLMGSTHTPIVLPTPIVFPKDIELAKECSVCIETESMLVLGCRHVVCTQCISKIDKCPVCRQELRIDLVKSI